MSSLCLPLFRLLTLSLLVYPAQTWADANSPLAVIQTTVERARQVLEDPASQGDANRQKRLEQVKTVVLPQFDAPEISKRTLGVYWKDRTEAQRKEFTELFTTLVEKTYSSTLDRYRKDVKVLYDRERIDGNFAQVDTRIFDPARNRHFAITYLLHNVAGKWLVYDVVIENVSMVRNYRNQFNRILTQKSYEDLVQALQAKIQQLDKGPPPSKNS